MTATWVPCDMCEEFICTVHEMHAADCPCPAIDTWAEDDHCPYDDPVTAQLRAWIQAHPFEDDD